MLADIDCIKSGAHPHIHTNSELCLQCTFAPSRLLNTNRTTILSLYSLHLPDGDHDGIRSLDGGKHCSRRRQHNPACRHRVDADDGGGMAMVVLRLIVTLYRSRLVPRVLRHLNRKVAMAMN